MKRLTLAARLLRVGVHLLRGVLECALLFPLLGEPAQARRIQRWSRDLTRLFGIVIVASGSMPRGGGALVANHISWLDVFVLNALAPGAFIAKADVRAWPVIGWLSARAGTWFLARDRRSSLRSTNTMIAQRLGGGGQLAFFPEGTSAAQGGMLPFHANLFQGVVAANATVHPVALAYLDGTGQAARSAEYIGDTSLVESILLLLSGPGCTAHVHFLAPILPDGDRRWLASAAHTAIDHCLGRLVPRSGASALDTA